MSLQARVDFLRSQLIPHPTHHSESATHESLRNLDACLPDVHERRLLDARLGMVHDGRVLNARGVLDRRRDAGPLLRGCGRGGLVVCCGVVLGGEARLVSLAERGGGRGVEYAVGLRDIRRVDIRVVGRERTMSWCS